jgi:hypothetical protein
MSKKLPWSKLSRPRTASRPPVQRTSLEVQLLERRDLPSASIPILSVGDNPGSTPQPSDVTTSMTATMTSGGPGSSSGSTTSSSSGSSSSSGIPSATSGSDYLASSLPSDLTASLNSLLGAAAANGQVAAGADGSKTYSDSWDNKDGQSDQPGGAVGLPGTSWWSSEDKGSYSITVTPFQGTWVAPNINGTESVKGTYTDTYTYAAGGTGSGTGNLDGSSSSDSFQMTMTITVTFQQTLTWKSTGGTWDVPVITSNTSYDVSGSGSYEGNASLSLKLSGNPSGTGSASSTTSGSDRFQYKWTGSGSSPSTGAANGIPVTQDSYTYSESGDNSSTFDASATEKSQMTMPNSGGMQMVQTRTTTSASSNDAHNQWQISQNGSDTVNADGTFKSTVSGSSSFTGSQNSSSSQTVDSSLTTASGPVSSSFSSGSTSTSSYSNTSDGSITTTQDGTTTTGTDDSESDGSTTSWSSSGPPVTYNYDITNVIPYSPPVGTNIGMAGFTAGSVPMSRYIFGAGWGPTACYAALRVEAQMLGNELAEIVYYWIQGCPPF